VRKGNETKLRLKLRAPAEFVINLSIRNFTLLLGPSLIPSGLRNAKEAMGLNLSRTCRALPGAKSPHVPCSSCVEKSLLCPSLLPVPKSRLQQLIIRTTES